MKKIIFALAAIMALAACGNKQAVTMAEEPSTWIFPRSGSLSLTMTSSNMSLPLLQQSIMVLPLMT